ncbi:aspartic proteinase 36-like [Wolffia australiana]
MSSRIIFLIAALFALFILPQIPIVEASGEAKATILTVERALPFNSGLEKLKAHDKARHGRLLEAIPGVVDFPVDGSSNPFSVGLYYTRVKLGNPPREFYVQIDTGSDILWVTCSPCNGCPTSSGLNIQLESFDPTLSSTASLISCSSRICSSFIETSDAVCTSSATQRSLCGYSFRYGDGSGTSGYYVSDAIYLDSVLDNGQVVNSSANVIFGCSNFQSGDLTKPDSAVDGIFGFGQHGPSVVSQLSSAGVTPKVFSHCLKGADNGGGILVLGEILEPRIVFSPLVQSQPHYNLNLQGISINGRALPIDPSVFSTSNTGGGGTIVDSGTTLAYLVQEAYDPFIYGITAMVSQVAQPQVIRGNQCFVVLGRVDQIFPFVTLTFEGNARMVLKPEDYLLQQGSIGDNAIWCIGWQKSQGQGVTILGDIVLKDKIFVYDLAGQRLGWANYDCSLSVNVSSSTATKGVINAGQVNTNESPSPRSSLSIMTLGLTLIFLNTLL